jgi:hypothetical protein
MIEEKIEIRGISRREIITYLIQLGAVTDNNHLFIGDDWFCYVADEDTFHMFQSQIPKIELIFRSEDHELLMNILKNFRKKTFRAGG